jgi:F-type H+/Na+-transporting ATPase subunit alpha
MSSQFISPLASSAVLELQRNIGFDCGISYDDLSKHAVSYRQLCLFMKKPAGREAFPSDVFYLHARILERSCALSSKFSSGTMMSLPIIETLNNDLSAYIATNVISITDGQLYMDVTLFGTGMCPAVSMEKSVSRVGAKSLEN